MQINAYANIFLKKIAKLIIKSDMIKTHVPSSMSKTYNYTIQRELFVQLSTKRESTFHKSASKSKGEFDLFLFNGLLIFKIKFNCF